MLPSIASLALLIASASAHLLPPSEHTQETLQGPVQDEDYHIPTIHESTVMARRIMHLSSISTLITTFPAPSLHSILSGNASDDEQLTTWENRPPEMAGSPIGLMEYYADCEPASGNPTLLAINIASPYKNYAAGSNISMHIRWWPTQTNSYLSSLFSSSREEEDIPTPHTPAALPRFSLHGRLEPISAADLARHVVPACFMAAHPDSALWQPGNDIHTSQYMRFVVEHIYWFGGFGDRARIGWLPVDEWRSVTRAEVEAMRLPGEEKRRKGWGGRDWL
ncbi:hypothetical protein BAUCODRAFT_73680 [Baudoinia panamericana UAMH 10762]|uniref:CREG-like beta-barrel domain-containing protein n=1 Tax=Baudoinia panamericana (strain UAMH 10762) TaxID=717646 RepID=M2MD14_BAUPA|nr:uncharacterized protein BAUCODRAFT_73680 [Baudoinia panamericana UAMH 10762]EMC94416.1 hypothetical protein BAUCODRAFT_73680 [Baudoinia panamericana UAMH 10762]